MPLQRIAVLGLGKVGTLAAKLLHAGGFDVTGFDTRKPHETLPFAIQSADVGSESGMRTATEGSDAVLSCLPYRINKRIATAAHDRGIHYFDLTEDVPTTEAIRVLSNTSRGLMAPQCGWRRVCRDRRGGAGRRLRRVPVASSTRRGAAATSDGTDGLRVQLVA
jgi:Saccharopine dehydrogenase and related proteins